MIPSLDIVIVNWNAGNLISECIDSISGTLDGSFKLNRIVVVDNNSSDDSILKIKKNNLPVEFIINKVNLGFAKACNQGEKNSEANYVLFLNPDTKLFVDSLSIPIKFLEKNEHKNIGILGIKMVDEDNNIFRHCSRFPNPFNMISFSLGLDKIFPKFFPSRFLSQWDHNSSSQVDQVLGAYFLIRKFVFDAVGGYDERFFVYYEDLDLALRIKELGFISYYLSEAKVFHKGGGTTEAAKSHRLFYNSRSKLLYAKKNYNYCSYILVTFVVLFIEPITRIIFNLSKFNFSSIPEIITGFYMLCRGYFQKKSEVNGI